jgi:hypothetical protein
MEVLYMGGQPNWNMTGSGSKDYIVNPKLQKEIYMKAYLKTFVGKLNGNARVKKQLFEGNTVSIANSSAIWETSITSGFEERMTMLEHRNGMPGAYGDAPSVPGRYDQYKHANAAINQIDSELIPLPGRCSQKAVKEVLTDPKGNAIDGALNWAAEEMDIEFIRAMLMGASRNLLLTSNGGLGERGFKLYNCNPGESRSSYNFYVPGTGLVTPSVVRATHEANVGTALATLADDSDYGMNLGQHNKMVDIFTGTIGAKEATGFGGTYKAIVLSDPWLVRRLSKDATLTGYYKDATPRSDDNKVLNHMDPILLDGVLYVPYDFLKAFRASVVDGLPVYGAGMSIDPRPYVALNSSKICLQLWLGAGSVVRATDRKIWITADNSDKHKENWQYGIHWDDGFIRREYGAQDGRTEMDADGCMVAAFYDPGVEVAFDA